MVKYTVQYIQTVKYCSNKLNINKISFTIFISSVKLMINEKDHKTSENW